VFDFTAGRVNGGLVTAGAEFFMFQFARDRLLVDPGLVVLHFTVLAAQVDVGVFSARHVNKVNSESASILMKARILVKGI
jgi:hypothetical protein